MNRARKGLLAGVGILLLSACGPGADDGPQGLPTGPSLQTPVPAEPGDPPPSVIPMPPEEPGTMPPGDAGGAETLIPTVQP